MNWLETLKQQCNERSQKWAAEQIGYAPAVVNQVLKGCYKGDLKRVQIAVEGAFLQRTVNCPVFGELAANRCLENQILPFAAINPTRVKLYTACRNCQHNTRGDYPQ